MKTVGTVALFLVTTWCFLHGWFALATVGVLAGSVILSTIWFIPLAFLIDGYFGAWYNVPSLSLTMIAWFAFFELLRPHIYLWQNKN